MKTQTWRRVAAGLSLGALLALAGCGGGSDGGQGGGEVQPPPGTTVQGEVLNAQDGQPVANATVSAHGSSVQTDAQGRFSFTLNDSDLALKAEKAGFSAGVASTAGRAGSQAPLRVWLRPVSVTQTVAAASAAVVTVPNSTAQVSLPAAALADSQTGAAFTGNAEVRVTPIDPAARPESMPGSYQARATNGSTTPIESFGALHVELRDPATGRALNLASGKTATIRIPLASRNPNPPATLPLYHLDEASGVWVEEGSATLVGSGPGAYYEGTVSHFSYWNADKPADTIYLDGCVRNADGSVPTGATVQTLGQDYSGSGSAVVGADGKFHVPMRRGGRALLMAETLATMSDPRPVGPYNADTTLAECLVLKDLSGQTPAIVEQPQSATVPAGFPYIARVTATPTYHVRYQWRRNGVDIAGANAPLLVWPATAADNGAVFTVVVGNGVNSVTSQPATLTVSGSVWVPNGQEEQLMRLMVVGLSGWELAMSPAQLTDDTMAALVAPASVCASGSLSQALYDGRAVAGGEPLTAGVEHTLDVSFAQCDAGGETLNGRGVMRFSFTRANGNVHVQGSSTITNLSSGEQKLTGNGTYSFDASFDEAQTMSQGSVTPTAGATLLSQASGLTARIDGGSMGWNYQETANTSTMTLKANNLAFTVDGVAYVSSGQLSTTFTNGGLPGGSGELRLTSGGTLVGRVFYDNGQLKFEVNGQVKPFAASRLAPRLRR